MYKSYFKIGWRNLLKNKGYLLVNVFGLAIGMTVTMLIGLWIYDELSFNKYHEHYNHIGRLWVGDTDPGRSEINGSFNAPYPLATTLKEKYPQYFDHVLRAWHVSDYTLSFGQDKFTRVGDFVDEGVIEMLSLKMLKGSDKSLHSPHSIILSRSTAESIFGAVDPINKVLVVNQEESQVAVIVTGVYEDIPENNYFGEVQLFMPWSLMEMSSPWIVKSQNDWDNKAFLMFVQLNEHMNAEMVNASIRDLYRKNVPEDYFKTIKKRDPFAQVIPMSTWHLYSEFENGKPAGGGILFVWLFGAIGIFVLLLACINFINLSTARSERRIKEVGIRKAIGSKRHQLIALFLSESFMIVALAFVVSLCLLIVFNAKFNELAEKNIILPFARPVFWVSAVSFMVATALIAGFYPALYLCGLHPVRALKGTTHVGRLSTLPRKILVIVQFTVSVNLIIGTLTVYQQIRFAQDRPVGYDRKGLITVDLNDPNFKDKIELLRNELLATRMVSEVAVSSTPLTSIWRTGTAYTWEGKDPTMDASFAICNVTADFGKAAGWKLVAGRDFSRSFRGDSTGSIIVNEAAVKYMGLKDPVGKQFINIDEFGRFKWSRTIVGVVGDLVMESPYQPVRQTLYYNNQSTSGVMHIRISPNIGASAALPKIESVFKKIVPTATFNYKFVDQMYANKFAGEQRLGNLSGTFAVLAILISSLGLFGLASFVTEKRTKEIGVRKVMGASVFRIWKMLSSDFVALVLIACVIAAPIAYYLMSSWLQKYTYRIDVAYWIFASVALGALVITIVTVSYQTITAAVANPVNSLRAD